MSHRQVTLLVGLVTVGGLTVGVAPPADARLGCATVRKGAGGCAKAQNGQVEAAVPGAAAPAAPRQQPRSGQAPGAANHQTAVGSLSRATGRAGASTSGQTATGRGPSYRAAGSRVPVDPLLARATSIGIPAMVGGAGHGLALALGALASGTGAGSAGPGAAATSGVPGAAAQVPSRAQVVTAARHAVATVQLPPTPPQFGPDPSANEWNMLAVGLPVWFWTADQAPVDASTTQDGIAISLVATPGPTTYDFGDGTTLTCQTSTPRPASAEPMAKSPDCGHTWTRHGTYTVTATTSWTMDWNTLGMSGTMADERTATTTVEVGQLASVIVR